jgi:Zn-dependent protease with chaperone function
MAVVLIAAGLALTSLPALARPVGRRITPAEWARLCLAALVGGAVAVEAGAILVAAPTLLRSVGAPALAQACGRMVEPLLPLGSAGGWAGVGLALVGAGLAVWGWRQATGQVRALAIEPGLGRHERRAGYSLVVLPTEEPVAYSVATPRPQVVVSQGLAEMLSPAELRAVVNHERAHLRHRHQDLLRLAATARRALAFWPPAARSHAVLRAAVERWADDAATGGDPRQRGTLRQALVRVAFTDPVAPVAAFSLVDATLERVEALDRPPRASLTLHVLLYVPGTVGAVAALVAVSGWVEQVHQMLAMAGQCTI